LKQFHVRPHGSLVIRCPSQHRTAKRNCSAGRDLLQRGPRGKVTMIPRYSRPEMAAIWSPETRFRIWFEIEAHAADAMAALGIIPKDAAKTIWAKGKNATFDIARIEQIERETKHDVIAF